MIFDDSFAYSKMLRVHISLACTRFCDYFFDSFEKRRIFCLPSYFSCKSLSLSCYTVSLRSAISLLLLYLLLQSFSICNAIQRFQRRDLACANNFPSQPHTILLSISLSLHSRIAIDWATFYVFCAQVNANIAVSVRDFGFEHSLEVSFQKQSNYFSSKNLNLSSFQSNYPFSNYLFIRTFT